MLHVACAHRTDCNFISNQTADCWATISCLLNRVQFVGLNPFTSKSDQFQISPAASPEILHYTVWRTWLFVAYLHDDYTTVSHFLACTFFFKRLELESIRVKIPHEEFRWTGVSLNGLRMVLLLCLLVVTKILSINMLSALSCCSSSRAKQSRPFSCYMITEL